MGAGIQPGDCCYCPVIQMGVKGTRTVAEMGEEGQLGETFKRCSKLTLTSRKLRTKIYSLPGTSGCVSVCLCE